MEDSPATQLIAVEIEYPEFATLINDIRDFDWKIINKLRREDLARVASTGLKFTTKGVENQRMELKTFLFEHPSCMASDFEAIISKLTIFTSLIKARTPQVAPTQQPTMPQQQQQPAVQYQQPAIQHQRRRRRARVITIEEEEEDDE